jgi:pyruvate formate lyase activating enzyme
MAVDNEQSGAGISRRRALKYTVAGIAGLSGACSLCWLLSGTSNGVAAAETTDIFKGDGPKDDIWAAWQKRGWVKECYHYRKSGREVQCQVCPNHCVLMPGDRSHCRNKVNRDGTMFTMAYANPVTFHVDPIEKKPLFHFLPGSKSFSLATTGCVLRCLNCQNWEISQKKPEEAKRADGPEYRVGPGSRPPASMDDIARMTMLPDDTVGLAAELGCPSISYTYSEPVAYFEYAYDACKRARERKVRNVLVTSGYIKEEPLRDIAKYVDAAHVDLKGFDDETYMKLNQGHLQPVLDTLKTLKREGVWFEMINLMVPTYTDDLNYVRRMCGWLVENLGPDHPLHFSRFHPAHKLTHLPETPVEKLIRAKEIAVSAGMRYVYLGNVLGVEGAENTVCPNCKKVVVERSIFAVLTNQVKDGACGFCGSKIAGVWA